MHTLRYTPKVLLEDPQSLRSPIAESRCTAKSPTATETLARLDTLLISLEQDTNRRSRLSLRRSRTQTMGSETSSFAILGKSQHAASCVHPPIAPSRNDTFDRLATGNLINYSQMNSAVTRTEGYFSGPYSQADVVSTVCSLAAEQHSWTEAYQNGQSTRDLLRRLLDGHKCDPYVLPEDGLLYAYVPEPDSDLEVSRLVPRRAGSAGNFFSMRSDNCACRLPRSGCRWLS